MKDITVLIADCRPLTRLGLKTALESVAAVRVVAEAACDVEAVKGTALLRPMVMVVDMGLPELGGVRTAQLARLDSPETRVVILGNGGTAEQAPLGFASRCSLLVPNDIASDALVSVVQHLAVADSDMDDAELQAIAGNGGPAGQAHNPLASTNTLTDREWEVLGWISCGLTNGEIARLLALSQHTIKNHVRSILRKLGAKNRTAASSYFINGAHRSPPHLSELQGIVRRRAPASVARPGLALARSSRSHR